MIAESDLSKWPSIGLAYEHIQAGYDLTERRLDAAHSRIDAALGLAATITVGAPILFAGIAKQPLDLHSGLWILSIGLFILVITFGIVAKVGYGGLDYISPERLYEGWLAFPEVEFKKNLLYWAGEHFRENFNIARWQARFADAIAIATLLEILCLALWFSQILS